MTTKEKTFVCEGCNRGYSSAQALGGHRKRCNAAAESNGTEAPQRVPVLPVNKQGGKHPRSLMWLVKKDWSILGAPLLGFCIGGVLTLYLPVTLAIAATMMGFMLGFVAIITWWKSQILPVEVLRKVSVTSHDGTPIEQTIRHRQWWAKSDARDLGQSAKRTHKGECYFIDEQESDAAGNAIQVVFNANARQARPELAPQFIRFLVAHEPTRIKYKTSLFSLSKEALTAGMSVIFIVIQVFVIVWAVGQLGEPS